MKFIKTGLLVIMCLLIKVTSMAQGFNPPDEGNAVVYFVRVSSYGGAVSFEFFMTKSLLGFLRKRIICAMRLKLVNNFFGRQVKNKQFVKANLEAGKTYIVLVNIKMGAWKAQVDLEPQNCTDPEQEEELRRAINLVNSKAPITTSQSVIDKTTQKLKARGFVENIMQRYENEWQYKDNYVKIITPDMFIPLKMLK